MKMPADAHELLSRTMVCVLATTGPGSSPHAIPMWYRYRDGIEASWAPLVLHVTPVSAEEAAWGGSRIGALVLVTDLANRMRFDAERVAALLGLTPAQSQIACLLALPVPHIGSLDL